MLTNLHPFPVSWGLATDYVEKASLKNCFVLFLSTNLVKVSFPSNTFLKHMELLTFLWEKNESLLVLYLNTLASV